VLQDPTAKEKKQGTRHRDELLAIQAAAQEKWAKMQIFQADAPEGGQPVPEGKFFGNFPYPYMNGVLHLGHAFSISKLEFATAYHRLCGKRVLFPQGFHCTGTQLGLIRILDS
jgi:leucyl-tRNA synthetase